MARPMLLTFMVIKAFKRIAPPGAAQADNRRPFAAIGGVS